MGFLFNQPAPQQAVPGDLTGFRQGLIGLLGNGGNTGILGQLGRGGFGSTLQQQSGTGIMQYLNQPAPEQQTLQTAMPRLQDIINTPGGELYNSIMNNGAFGGAFQKLMSGQGSAFNMASPALQGILGSSSAGVLDPLRASMNQNLGDQLSQMNASTPGRFSTANLYQQGQLRQRSMNDFNTLGTNILQQGVQNQLGAANTLGALYGQQSQNQLGAANTLGGLYGQGVQNQLGAANTLGALSGQAGQAPFNRLATAQQLGQGQSGMNLQALLSLLGLAGGPAFGGPFTQQQSPFGQMMPLIGALAGMFGGPAGAAAGAGMGGSFGQTGSGNPATSGFNPNRTLLQQGGGGYQSYGGGLQNLFGG